MLYEVTSSDVVTHEHWASDLLMESSSKKSDRVRVESARSLEALVLAVCPSLLPIFEIDLSSVNPCLAPINRPSSIGIQEFYEQIAPEEGIEYDLAIRMPPKDRRAIKLEVKDVKKGKPIIIEPDWMAV